MVGSTSGAGARFCDCNCSTVYVNIANHVKAIEEKEKIDVTPCTDANGKFEPSPACNALMTSPQDGMGTFPACSVAHTSEAINSCAGMASAAAGSGGTAGKPTTQPSAAGASAQAGRGSSPNITMAVGVATMPAAAFEPTSSKPDTSSAAAGHPAIGSLTFGTTAAGGPAVEPPAPEKEKGGCQVGSIGASTNNRLGLAAFALSLLGLIRTRRRSHASAKRS